MKLRYWLDFNKRQNSTKRPDLTKGTEIEVYIKDDCSLENPVFVVSDNLKTWSYCYAPSLGRYYFITDIVTIDSWQFEVHCTLDAAATYRDSIFAYTAFVERAASSYDVLINDNALSSTQDYVSISQNSISIGFQDEMYIVPVSGITGMQLVVFPDLASANIFNNSGQYSASISGHTLTVADILDDADAIKAVFKQVGYSFMNPTDYMGQMLAFPFTDNNYQSRPLSLGMWNSGTNAYMMLPTGWGRQATLNFPASPYSDFRKANSQFTTYWVYLPGLGNLQIPSLDAAENDLTCTLIVDYFTGCGQYIIKHSGGGIVGTYNTQIGSVVPYGKSDGLNFGNVITTAIGGAQNVAGGAAGGAAGAASMGLGLERLAVDTIRTAFDSNVSVFGGAGSLSIIKSNPNIICTTKAVGSKEFPTAEYGRPLCRNVTLGSLSGFVKCGNASVPLVALDHVRSEINNMLNSGIYIE